MCCVVLSLGYCACLNEQNITFALKRNTFRFSLAINLVSVSVCVVAVAWNRQCYSFIHSVSGLYVRGVHHVTHLIIIIRSFDTNCGHTREPERVSTIQKCNGVRKRENCTIFFSSKRKQNICAAKRIRSSSRNLLRKKGKFPIQRKNSLLLLMLLHSNCSKSWRRRQQKKRQWRWWW